MLILLWHSHNELYNKAQIEFVTIDVDCAFRGCCVLHVSPIMAIMRINRARDQR